MAQSTQDLKDPQKRAELDERARKGETVIPGGTRGTNLEAQEHLAEGRRKGGLSTMDQSGDERAREEGIPSNPLEAQEKQEGEGRR